MILSILLLVCCCFLASLLLTNGVRHYALNKAILDIPNARSAHVLPTPRGGGLAMVLVFLGSALVLTVGRWVPQTLMIALLGGGLAVALVGWRDDIKPVGAKWRFSVHLLAALWTLYWLGGLPLLDFGGVQVQAGWWGGLLALIAIIWSINLYNFMDGIDGLAASEGVFIGVVAGVFCLIAGDRALALLSFSMAATIGGFLYWNWSPAKIFMGDVGSGFLGYVFITIAIQACNQHDQSLIFWLLLFAVFLTDATFTLIYRVLKKQTWYEAHREHAYQKVVDAGWSHRKTTLFILVLNLVILLPAVVYLWYYPRYSLAVWLAVSCGLALLWLRTRRLTRLIP